MGGLSSVEFDPRLSRGPTVPPSISLTEFFHRLGAPLANSRWSWGGVRPDGAVFLRVWQDRTRQIDGKPHAMLTHHSKYADSPQNLGYQERLRQVELIQSGAPCFLVMCRAKDPKAAPRAIASFNVGEVFVGGASREVDGDTWIELAGRRGVDELIVPADPHRNGS